MGCARRGDRSRQGWRGGLHLEGFGRRDVENRLPVDGETLFFLGGPTKGFTSLSLAILVDDGRLDWDTPVVEYLPQFRLHDDYRTLHTTPRDLLLHRTGLSRYEELICSPYSRDEMVRRLRYLKPTQPFRAGYGYTDLTYVAAGYMVGRLVGSTWERFAQERILVPAGMERTTLRTPGCDRDENFAHPYERFEARLRRARFVPYE